MRKVIQSILSGPVIATILLLLMALSGLKAQFYNGSQTDFGKNRVQYNNLEWTFFKYENFDIYFYNNGKELALFTAQYAESQIKDIQRLLETNLEAKIQFIVFNTQSESRQSNLGLMAGDGTNSGNTGGITRILDQKVILAFNGDHSDFQRQIRQGVTQVVLNQLLYGSSLTSQVKNSTLLFLPDWYLNGLLSYLSEEWSTAIDDKVRDGIISGRYKKFNQLTGPDAMYAGHSFWRFIAERYGSNVVPNVVYMAKISKSVESGFMYVLGVSFKSVVAEWLSYYQGEYAQDPEGAVTPDLSARLIKPKSRQYYSQLKVSPAANYAAFATNESGRYRVVLVNLANRKSKTLIKRGFKLDEEIDYSYPLLGWHPSGQLLTFITEEKGRINMYLYSVGKRSLEKRFLFNFDKVIDFAYSPDGKSLVMSAVIKGQSDIFIYNVASNSFEQVTKDIFDDCTPRFINKGKDIIFASNRIDDSLSPRIKTHDINKLNARKDLFVYHLSGKKKVLKRITNTPLADEKFPMEYENNFITYLSDANGISNRYLARFDSAISYVDTTTHYRYFTISYPVTNFARSIVEHDIVPSAGLAGDLFFIGNRYNIIVSELPEARSLTAAKSENSTYANSLVKLAPEAEKDSASSIKKKIKASAKRFVNVKQDEIDVAMDTLFNRSKVKIDINNYIFEKQSFIKLLGLDTLKKGATGQADLAILRPPPVVAGPKQLNYLVEFSLNQLVTQLDFFFLQYTYQPFTGGNSPIWLNPGFSILLKVGATDLMEDYRIVGGMRPSLTFTNNEYLLSFSNFKRRLDHEFTFHRQVLENTTYSPIYANIKTNTYEVFYNAKYPFNRVRAIKFTSLLRNDRTAYLSQEPASLKQPNDLAFWASLKTEMIYDDTRNLGLNLLKGTRYKVFAEYFQQLSPKSQTLYVLGLDFRHYVKVHRSMIWATRFAASTSFGNSQLIYYLGGVDYWLAPKFNYGVPINTAQNYAYQTLATNMRGFDQNIRNGNTFALINTELRLPIFRYFINRPIKSDFINNFQVIGFGDIGSAWTGSDPYSKDNSLYTKVITKYPITVTIDNQIEPIVAGYGFGLRSRLLGYFLRADWAWGVEDKRIGKSIFYFSMGLDF